MLEWAARGSGGVTNPEGIQGTFGHRVEGHSLVRTTGDGWLDWMILWVFSNPSDSMIL